MVSSTEVALNLALAVISSSNAPVLLLDGDLTVIAASTSFCRAFRIDTSSAAGRKIYALGEGEWATPKLRSLLSATVSGGAEIEAYEMDLKSVRQGTRRLVLNAHKLNYADNENVRLLLAVSDVTEARVAEKLKDDLLREKAVLMQEVQHRVANSLQIIASVLMQSARRVQSEETRGHLNEAHNRVMSVASLQRQLAASGSDDVELRSYFTQLCESLGASMIRDHNQLTIVVDSDEGSLNADVSVSLGLIVTELVINALKHAFPSHQIGKIKVKYRSDGEDWSLSVSDDGVGMPLAPSDAKSGLGTSIVTALANQLQAIVRVDRASPGTAVSIIHTKSTALASESSVNSAV